jgi:transcriptional regulator with XRE-family HTH domain
MAARKKEPASRKKPVRKSAASSSGTRKKKAKGAAEPAAPARSVVASLADRLAELVEHAAASALRGVVDRGGRSIASRLPQAQEMRREAGSYLRELREVAGLTRDELADAVELGDHSLLGAVEAGTATLSFELTLRLAAVLARHDPVPFVSRLVRTYNPLLWELLEDWGVGRLPLQLEREREFVNILRGHDAVRALSDEDFAQVLDFTRAAFETALHFAEAPGAQRPGKAHRGQGRGDPIEER